SIRLGEVLEDLEPDRAVARHHRVVAERMHEETFDALPPARAERVEPLVVRYRDDVGAESLDRRQLRRGRAVGDDDGAPDAEPPRVPRDALSHVAGARGPHPIRELLGGGDGHAIARTTDLERADGLQALELEVDVRRRGVDVEPHERRAERRAGDAPAGRPDLGEPDQSTPIAA